MKSEAISEKLYDYISGDEEARVCKDIPEQSCIVVPRNFFLHLSGQFLSKIGDVLSSPGLVLTWLLSHLAVPAALIALLVPIREVGSLLPQMAFGGVVRAYPIRKWFWIAGSALQGGSVIMMGVVAFRFEGSTAGLLVIGLLLLFSAARGICSIASKDIIGKTVPKMRRGRLGGLSASLAGIVSLAVGAFFIVQPKEDLAAGSLMILLFVAGAAWIAAAWVMTFLAEAPGATSGGGNALKAAFESFRILRDDRAFRTFCIVRGLLASTVLSMPFYVVLAREATGGKAAGLGLLMGVSSLAAVISGWVWGRFADHSSRMTLITAGWGAGIIGCLTAGLSLLTLSAGANLWMYGGLFFLLGLAHTGIRIGRKTYLIDIAPGELRASYTAVSNTVIGAILLVSGSIGTLSGFMGARGVILFFAVLGIAGGCVGLTLKDVEDDP